MIPREGIKCGRKEAELSDVFLLCFLWTMSESLAGLWTKGTGPFGTTLLQTVGNSKPDFAIGLSSYSQWLRGHGLGHCAQHTHG